MHKDALLNAWICLGNLMEAYQSTQIITLINWTNTQVSRAELLLDPLGTVPVLEASYPSCGSLDLPGLCRTVTYRNKIRYLNV